MDQEFKNNLSHFPLELVNSDSLKDYVIILAELKSILGFRHYLGREKEECLVYLSLLMKQALFWWKAMQSVCKTKITYQVKLV